MRSKRHNNIPPSLFPCDPECFANLRRPDFDQALCFLKLFGATNFNLLCTFLIVKPLLIYWSLKSYIFELFGMAS